MIIAQCENLHPVLQETETECRTTIKLALNHLLYLPAGRALRMWPAGPKITLRFPRLYIFMCVCTYHVRNNYVTCHATLL